MEENGGGGGDDDERMMVKRCSVGKLPCSNCNYFNYFITFLNI